MRKRGLNTSGNERGVPDENLPDFATLQKTRQHLFKSAPFIALKTIFAIRKIIRSRRRQENRIFSKRLYDMQHPSGKVIALRSRA